VISGSQRVSAQAAAVVHASATIDGRMHAARPATAEPASTGPQPPAAAAPVTAARPTDPVRDSATATAVLLDTDDIRIEHFQRGGAGGTLVVTFDPIAYNWNRPPFGHEFLHKQALDVVAVRKKGENFYQPLSRAAFAAAVRPVAAQYQRVVSYGSSLGAYAALYFGRDEPWIVIASSPRNSTHPKFGTRHWQDQVSFRHERFGTEVAARCHAFVLFDPQDPMDRRYIEGEVLPQFPAAEVLRVPYSGHPTNQMLGDIGFIAPFIRAVIADLPRAQWPALERRALRHKSSSYLHVLGLAALEHGHLAWADSLVGRALALRPKSPAALGVLARIRLLQHDGPGAVQAAEAALVTLPGEPSLLALLERGRRASAAPPPAAPSAAPTAAPTAPTPPAPAPAPCAGSAINAVAPAQRWRRWARRLTRWLRPE
jgi:hypothetical protein